MKTGSFFTFSGAGLISIARSLPKSVSPSVPVFSALAPGKWFQRVTRAEYVKRYRAEILGALDPSHTLDALLTLADGAEPVLCCWEVAPLTETNWCHRRLVAEWFGEKLGLEVLEMAVAPRAPRESKRATSLRLPGFST